MEEALVKDWMTRNVETIPPDMTLPEAERLMHRKNIGRLPVVKEGDLVGIVTRGDVQSARPADGKWVSVWELNYLLSTMPVEAIMTSAPITVTENATIGQIAQLMLENKVSALPVVGAAGKITGIITESDIFRMVAQGWDQNRK